MCWRSFQSVILIKVHLVQKTRSCHHYESIKRPRPSTLPCCCWSSLSLKAERVLPLSAIMILLYLHRLLSAAHHKWIFGWQYQGKPGWAELWSHNRLCCVQSQTSDGDWVLEAAHRNPSTKPASGGFDSSNGFPVTDLCGLCYWQVFMYLFFFVCFCWRLRLPGDGGWFSLNNKYSPSFQLNYGETLLYMPELTAANFVLQTSKPALFTSTVIVYYKILRCKRKKFKCVRTKCN